MRIFFVFFLCCFSILFAEEKCAYFSYTNYDKIDSMYKKKEGLFGPNVIPNYSKVYTSIDFIDNIKPGIYFFIRYLKDEVNLYGFISENSDLIQLYMEPAISRDYIYSFSPCIDQHIKKNIDVFLQTCIQNKKLDHDKNYKILNTYFSTPYEKLDIPCDCDQIYDVELVQVFLGGQMHTIKYKDISCLDESLFINPRVTKFRNLDSLVKTIINVEQEKCNWRNLVTNPERFSSKKYDRENYLILSKKDCPVL